ncbi:prostatic acid phosphatase-like isoform X1 [Homalodisca vitripennis]|uniref:prostatic acid phosphatase-like isoform X1 n=1 Tax=Homalodisca vitripennis TaxID=197043 RepID=UPI001EE9B95A|nr:prostatic acid phosphatase-like isoform X1 [Homalodisca vitripennis]
MALNFLVNFYHCWDVCENSTSLGKHMTKRLLLSSIVIVVVVVLTLVYCQSKGSTGRECVDTNTRGTRSVSTLQFVIVVARHGNRGPLSTFTTIPYQSNDTSVWPYGVGELTQIGRVQMYKLGEKVRSMYNGFLDSTYRPRDFQALSSPSTRTLQSAELFLAGLFPPTGFQVWNQDICWQPIPIYPSSLDHYEILDYAAETSCPRFSEPQKDSLQEINRLYQSSLTSFVDYVIPHTGIDVMDVMQKIGSLYKLRVVAIVWETLKYVADNELPLPDWATKIYPEPLNNLFSKIFKAIVAGSTDQIKYLEGELFQELVGLMQAKANNTLSPDRRMYYYSGHDYTIMGLLAMLNPQREAYVNPGSALIYELHQNPSTGQFTVQVLYIDGKSPDLNPQDIDIVGCESPCDFHKMLKITEKYYNISNWKEECHLGPTIS